MKSFKRNYELALEALAELTEDLSLTTKADEIPKRPQLQLAPAPLAETISGFGRLPSNALFLGAAYDGLPILLNLNDPTPGPILVAGDQGSGKTAFLQIIAQASPLLHTPEEVQFGIITAHPDEWAGFEEIANCMGIFPTHENKTEDFILSLADWAHNNRHEKRFALLLIDDLETITEMGEDVQQSLRWLLLRGPNRKVWTFTTLNAGRTKKVLPWLDAFRTRLFGAIKNAHDAETIVPKSGAALHLLEPGLEFILNENRQWVKFWIPPVDPIL
jgi:hypothetical protein